MMDWEEYFPSALLMMKAIDERLLADKERINYVNIRYKLLDEKESAWIYDITLKYHDSQIIIISKDGEVITLAENELDYLKIRPFYFAKCIGFKAFVLYPHLNTNDEQCL